MVATDNFPVSCTALEVERQGRVRQWEERNQVVDIYEQHRAAFAQVEAFVILKGGERVATIAFKFPRDGAGRLYAYAHWIGLEMVRGFATGGGYDKRTAACASAAAKLPQLPRICSDGIKLSDAHFIDFRRVLLHDTGPTWDWQLRNAGFTVLQAV